MVLTLTKIGRGRGERESVKIWLLYSNSFPDIYFLIIYSEVAMFVSFCLNIHKLSTKLKSGEANSPPSQTGLNWGWA